MVSSAMMKPASHRRAPAPALALASLALACGDPPEPYTIDASTQTITHAFGALTLPAQSDNAQRCVSWRLGNEAALYVQSVRLANEGSFHHSNWIVVPEDAYPGPDGYWSCPDRNFEEVSAAQQGTVLFAQSTQSFDETQKLSAGAVIKIPPRHKIVGLLHTLNTAPRDASSGLWLTLELLHPSSVKTIVTPMTMQYRDLAIPGNQESRFTGVCDLSIPHGLVSLQPLDLRLHYILPHYHYLGNYFDVSVIGGQHDGESVFRMTGFNGEGNGRAFDPPLALSGATGLRFTCGYDNWRDKEIGYGIGDQEMCVMLGLADMRVMMNASVDSGNQLVGADGEILLNEGPCAAIAIPKNASQAMPSAAELAAPLYVPPAEPGDVDLDPVKKCVDIPADAAPLEPATLASLRETVFNPSCTFSSCHGGKTPVSPRLDGADLHAQLLAPATQTKMPLVDPGKPDNSWLYQLVAHCEPRDADDHVFTHMPYNSPTLLEPRLAAKLRAWIEAGAPAQ